MAEASTTTRKNMTRDEAIAELLASDNAWAQMTGAVMQHDPKITHMVARVKASKIIQNKIQAPWL